MTIRIMINGAFGNMGKMASVAIDEHLDFTLCARLGRQDNLRQMITMHNPDVVLDLTRADVVYQNTFDILDMDVRPVIGTSGLKIDEITRLQNIAAKKKIGGLIVPNFSIAAVLMMTFAAQAAKFMSEVEIVETHHPKKYDAPSGTALKTAEMIQKIFKEKPSSRNRPILSSDSPVRGENHEGVHIHSLRLPGKLARQEVIFGQPGETLSILHESIDRISFKPGILLACRAVLDMQELKNGLEQVLPI